MNDIIDKPVPIYLRQLAHHWLTEPGNSIALMEPIDAFRMGVMKCQVTISALVKENKRLSDEIKAIYDAQNG
jgi:hypothetical protein